MRLGRFAGVLLLVLCLGWGGRAWAAEQFPSSPTHRGIAKFDPYEVFPENRPGNAVYLNDQLIFTQPDLTIVDVLPLPADGRFTYYALDAQGQAHVGVFTQAGDGTPRIKQVTPNFYHVVVVLGGVVYKKMYRVVNKNLQDLLPDSKTADGPVAGPGGVVFYHVATAINTTQNGQTTHGFGLKLHLAPYGNGRVQSLSFLITNDKASLALKWVDDTHIQVGLTDGRTQVIGLDQFK